MQNEQTPKPDNQQETRALNPVARRNARRYALQAMYIWNMKHDPIIDLEKEFVQYHINKEYDHAYFKELIYGIPKQVSEIDNEIIPNLGRSIEEINPIEHAVLRVAIYELLYRPDVPYRVVINEALELTKKYGSAEGHKFVNGILDRIAKKIRQTEIGMDKKEK
jgi:N utilization substance protein B